MLDLRQQLCATARVPIEGRYQVVTGRVIGQTFERDPVLDIRLDTGAIVHVRESEASIGVAGRAPGIEPVPASAVTKQ
jgi:hypothetical protein